MNKKLGALALVGASAVVLAGCAGGSGATPERGGDRRDHRLARRHRHARHRARVPQGDVRGRERGLDAHDRGEDLGRHERDLRRRAVVQRLARRRRGRQHPGARLHRPGPVPRHHRHPGRPRRRRPAPGSRRRRHLRRRVLRRPVLRRWPHRLLHAADRDGGRSRRRSTSTSRKRHRDAHRHRLGHLRAGQGLVQRASLRVGARRRDRRPGRRHLGRPVLERRVRRGPRAAPGGLPERDERSGGRRRGQPAGALLRRRDRLTSRLPAG